MLFYYLPLGASRDLTESQSHKQAGKKGDHSENSKVIEKYSDPFAFRAGIWTFIIRSQAKSMDYAYRCQLEM